MSLLDSTHPPSNNNNSSSVRSQARSTRWINRNRVNAQLTSLAAGRQSALHNHSPTHEVLVQQVQTEYGVSSPTPPSVSVETQASAAEIRQSLQSELKLFKTFCLRGMLEVLVLSHLKNLTAVFVSCLRIGTLSNYYSQGGDISGV